MSNYKWDSPYDWLAHASTNWDEQKLHATMMQLAGLLDSDALQELFEPEMDGDGYFKRIWEAEDKELNDLTRERIVELLEGISIECSDDDTTPTLRAALAEALNDGDIDESDLTV